ncbi:single-stranded-DNA-specific exonuclease RecJ [Parvularcula sp. ZS-1/3]|uniref:Single-stranded-DNA-specific exonuclease RecJ n=1 Tax=Parvularcula mediterranea TaxID=2732508 RepID=A0A7Y3RLN2_9PROT|nr:single-stranded-DNA-specific exonuclease RecJ [Parvularcula mediterranea]NNU16364.1 single-stranded-DNA-specific exonuclease RecJ [Parvularcula mediterranea]
MPLDSPALADAPLLGVEHSAKGQVWKQRPICRRSADLAVQRYGVDPLLADVLVGRGVEVEELKAYLSPSLKSSMPDPSVLLEMDEAAARIADAVERGETIGIFGDYDVDGTSAASLLFRYFRELGTEPVVHLPDRFTEGYGPSTEGFRNLEERGASLILTVDCGSNHGDVVGRSSADVIVLDHHLMGERPDVFALVNPQREGDHSGLTGLSAGGVAFMAAVATNRELRKRGAFETKLEPKLMRLLDLVALSLVGDVMPLRGLTRVLVAQGLRLIGTFEEGGGNAGLRALAEVAGLSGQAQVSHLGFQIGPRINAAGRIGHARIAFDLLTTDEPSRAASIAQKLEALNKERRRIEDAVRREAQAQVDAQIEAGQLPEGAAIVAAGEGWHPGVVGIVAGRLKERYHRPAFCIAMEGGKGTGSGRSLTGVDLGSAVSAAAAAGVIDGGGGHAMAAGLSLREEQIDGFRAFLADRLSQDVTMATEERPLTIDAVVSVGAIHGRTCKAVAPAGPFGAGHPEPRFAVADVVIRHARQVGDRHLAITIEDAVGNTARGIAFGVIGEPIGDLLQSGDRTRLHLAGRITPDTWRGGEAAQFELDDAAEA